MIENILIFIIGLTVGSFLNMLIYRVPNQISLFNPSRSICQNCKNNINWYDNIPFFSYIFLNGKCRQCDSKISIFYPLVELLTATVFLLVFLKIGFSQQLIFTLVFFSILILLSSIDFKYLAVPDYLLLLVFINSFFISDYSFIENIQIAMMFAGGFVLLNFIVSFYIQNIKSRILKNDKLKNQEALGEGDIPIIASIGVILGIKLGLIAIFLSAIFAIIPAIYNSLTKQEIEIAFIPYLSLGLFCAYIFDKTFIKLIG